MKKLLFFLLLSGFAFGQQLTLKTTDSIQFRNQVEELVKNTGKNYTFHETVSDRQMGTYLEYTNPEDAKDRLQFYYFDFYEGENKELEQKGVRTWQLYNVTGKFLSLFPLWQKYEDQNANPELIVKNGSVLKSKSKNGYSIVRISSENVWKITF